MQIIKKLISYIWSHKIQFSYVLKGKINTITYRYAFKKCGSNLNIFGQPLILNPGRIEVGNNVSINNGAQLCPHGQIVIGNNVSISRGAQITSGQLDTRQWKENRLTNVLEHVNKDVYIGDGTWLCINSVVLPGVKITGIGVIVAAGAVVNKDITEDFVIVGGIPARIIKRI